jgi:hypothetical protein
MKDEYCVQREMKFKQKLTEARAGLERTPTGTAQF